MFITCYNCGKAGYTRPEYPHPRRDANLNKIIEQEDNNNNIKEIQQIKDYILSGNRNI
jgi:hypothetical protein